MQLTDFVTVALHVSNSHFFTLGNSNTPSGAKNIVSESVLFPFPAEQPSVDDACIVVRPNALEFTFHSFCFPHLSENTSHENGSHQHNGIMGKQI